MLFNLSIKHLSAFQGTGPDYPQTRFDDLVVSGRIAHGSYLNRRMIASQHRNSQQEVGRILYVIDSDVVLLESPAKGRLTNQIELTESV